MSLNYYREEWKLISEAVDALYSADESLKKLRCKAAEINRAEPREYESEGYTLDSKPDIRLRIWPLRNAKREWRPRTARIGDTVLYKDNSLRITRVNPGSVEGTEVFWDIDCVAVEREVIEP